MIEIQNHCKSWDENNLYGLAMTQKLPVKDFIWVENKFSEDFIKNYNENSYISNSFEVDVKNILKNCIMINDLPFLTGELKMESLKDLQLSFRRKKYVIHITNLKQPLNQGKYRKKSLQPLDSYKTFG